MRESLETNPADFLDQPTSFTIPANDLRDTQPVRDAIIEGTLNTLRVSVVGIIPSRMVDDPEVLSEQVLPDPVGDDASRRPDRGAGGRRGH